MTDTSPVGATIGGPAASSAHAAGQLGLSATSRRIYFWGLLIFGGLLAIWVVILILLIISDRALAA